MVLRQGPHNSRLVPQSLKFHGVCEVEGALTCSVTACSMPSSGLRSAQPSWVELAFKLAFLEGAFLANQNHRWNMNPGMHRMDLNIF